MRITVKFFASTADLIGSRQIALDLDEGATVGDLREAVGEQYPKLRPFLPTIVCAVNESYESPQTVLREGDDVALIPPVSGG
jgi:molybdopterin converting factor subunit 1